MQYLNLVVKTPCIDSLQNLTAHLANEALLSLVRVAGRKVGLQCLSAGKFLLAHVAFIDNPLLVGLPMQHDVGLQDLCLFFSWVRQSAHWRLTAFGC